MLWTGSWRSRVGALHAAPLGSWTEFSKQWQEPVRMPAPPTSLIQGVPFPCSRFRAAEQTPGLAQQFWLTVWQLRTNLLLLVAQGKMLQGAVAAWGPLHTAEPATAAVRELCAGQMGKNCLALGSQMYQRPCCADGTGKWRCKKKEDD